MLAQLVDHPRILRVAVREVGCPDEAVGAAERAERADRPLAGVEADPALPAEVVGRLERERRRGPVVALEELVHPVHPVADPAAAALEHRDLQPRVPFEHAAVDQVRQRHLLVELEDQRVVRARRHQIPEVARRAGHVGEPGGVQGEREPGLLERLPDRCVHLVVEVPVVVGVRAGEAADQPEVADAVRLRGRGLRVLHGERADADEAGRARPQHHSAIQSL